MAADFLLYTAGIGHQAALGDQVAVFRNKGNGGFRVDAEKNNFRFPKGIGGARMMDRSL